MRLSHFSRFLLFAFVGWLLFLLGCATTSKQARFYKLSSVGTQEAPSQTQATGQGLGIGIGPIKFPDHLDRPQIVTRTSANAMQLSEFDLWAGSLREDFSRVLAENLSILLSTDYIFIYPFTKSTPIDYKVAVEVVRFDGELGKSAALTARWTVMEGDRKALKFVRRSKITGAVDDSNYEAMVAALSRTVESLSREIAESIRSLSR
ncbi:MAG: PqiC family protein [Desulfobacteraceae bacterium]